MIKANPLIFLVIIVLFGCEKHDEDIFNNNFRKLYGEWVSYEKCGGISGACTVYEGETLIIMEYGKFFITSWNGNYVQGYIKVVSQDSNDLTIQFERRKGKLRLFSRDDLTVTFSSNDSVSFSEGCCDRLSYYFIRN